MPLSVTLASKSIYQTFVSAQDRKEEALLHGHSYTAHPIGCEVARETLRILGKMDSGSDWADDKSRWQSEEASRQHTSQELSRGALQSASAAPSSAAPNVWSFWSPSFVHSVSERFASSVVAESMAMGTVLVVKLRDSASEGYSSKAAAELVTRLRTSTDIDASVMDNPSVPLSPQGGAKSSLLPFKIHARPLGNVVYIMCSLNTPAEVRAEVEKALWAQLLLEEQRRATHL